MARKRSHHLKSAVRAATGRPRLTATRKPASAIARSRVIGITRPTDPHATFFPEDGSLYLTDDYARKYQT